MPPSAGTPGPEIGNYIAIGLFAASASAKMQTSANAAAEFIVGNCFRSVADILPVHSLGRASNWYPLSAGMANFMKPVDAVGYEAWHVIQDGQHYFVEVNSRWIDGRPTEVCSVVANQHPELIVPLILKMLTTRLVQRDAGGFQVSETYEIEHATQPKVLLMIAWGSDNQPPVSFDFVGLR
jgi:hypothetical protein